VGASSWPLTGFVPMPDDSAAFMRATVPAASIAASVPVPDAR
jgi:hypothetical protein